MYQILNGTSKLIGYASKSLPPAALSYSMTELELLASCVNISQFKHLLAKVDFAFTVDHLALTYIMKSITEPDSAGNK